MARRQRGRHFFKQLLALIGVGLVSCGDSNRANQKSRIPGSSSLPEPARKALLSTAGKGFLPNAAASDDTRIEHPENYVPKTVTLRQSITVAKWKGDKHEGFETVHSGTKVKVARIEGSNVVVDYKDNLVKVRALGTDLLDQMLEAAEK